ncbi:cellulose binding domain-containing protein [Micromonospora sp. RHAY321]|uniref:cellulose binding domain-containing protein n=1 Tax=Micromonospora sp. RHAY321 TaxID=2944807 RepID=UPI00207C6809|nr:cellulose binding domain-containing protein [Micromonospora sp. RHAY321]MCO1595966.1 cellulose binding domain-containing protein [Micromonospora sp. RHAY321]
MRGSCELAGAGDRRCWNATVTQSGTTVTAAAPSLPAGASVTVGFTANGTATPPTAPKLNPTAC